MKTAKAFVLYRCKNCGVVFEEEKKLARPHDAAGWIYTYRSDYATHACASNSAMELVGVGEVHGLRLVPDGVTP